MISLFFLSVPLVIAAANPPAPHPNMPPQQTQQRLWTDDFNPQTKEEKVDTDSETDEDVIIMEEDEDSEAVPGNTNNPSQ